MRAHARIRIRCERVQCEHMRMRAFASHCMRTHFSCVMRAFAYVIWASSVSVMRAYARICAHSHAMRAHSHRMRSHSHRMRSHRMRMRAFKGNLCVSGTVIAFPFCFVCVSCTEYTAALKLDVYYLSRLDFNRKRQFRFCLMACILTWRYFSVIKCLR